MSSFVTLNTIRRRLAAALLVALLALALPHAANAQPILRGKMQQAAPAAVSLWQPVRDAFAGPGRNAMPSAWGSVAAQRLNPPVVVVEAAPAPAVPSIEQLIPVPAAPWLHLFLP